VSARGAAPAVATAVAASFGRVGRPRGGRGAKRTSADLEALSERFASFVKANPGLRIEQINKQLGTTTKDLALPIRKLISEGVISAKGQKRSTTYFPGKKKGKN
jgi:predicted HTH transcriptional regulator